MLGGDRASGWDEMDGAAAVGAAAATRRPGLRRSPPRRRWPRRALALLALGAMALAFAGASGAGAAGRPRSVGAGPGRPAGPPLPAGGQLMNCAQTVGKVVWLCVGPRLQALDLSDRKQPRVLGADGGASGRPQRAGTGGGQRARLGAGRPDGGAAGTSATRRSHGSWRGWG